MSATGAGALWRRVPIILLLAVAMLAMSVVIGCSFLIWLLTEDA